MKQANISNSFLPEDMQNGYCELLRTRHEELFQWTSPFSIHCSLVNILLSEPNENYCTFAGIFFCYVLKN